MDGQTKRITNWYREIKTEWFWMKSLTSYGGIWKRQKNVLVVNQGIVVTE